MRRALVIVVLALLPLAACRDTHVSRGMPVLAKAPDGVLISGADGLPDIERGNQERLAGRLDEAERDLLPLAQRGYAAAQMYLAAVYGQREAADSQDEAIKWYRTVLPQRPEAAVPVSRLLMHQGDRDSVMAANELLLRAGGEGVDEASVNAATLDLYSLFPALDEKRRGPAMAQKAGASSVVGVRASAINWYRASLSDAGNARRLVELCRQNRELIPACYIDLATYYRYKGNTEELAKLVDEAMRSLQRPMSYANFDDFYYDPVALPPVASRLVVALIDQPLNEDPGEVNEDLALAKETEANAAAEAGEESLDEVPATGALPQYADAPEAPAAAEASRDSTATTPPATPSNAAHPELADKLLRWMLKQPGAMAVEAAGVAVSFPYLLPDVNLESVLKTGISAGIPRASLYLGQLCYFNQRVPREAVLGESHLMESVRFRETAAPGHYRLGRLYQQGYLGRPDPQKALENFLYAARRRVTAADTHLARLFYDSPGTRIDRVSSYVFARLSEDGGVPVVVHSLRGGTLSTYRLLDRLRVELTADELRKAESLYQQEREVHLVMRPDVSPDIWVKDAG